MNNKLIALLVGTAMSLLGYSAQAADFCSYSSGSPLLTTDVFVVSKNCAGTQKITGTDLRTFMIGDTITNDVVDVAPSQNAVYDALALKSDTGHAHTASDVTDFSTSAKSATVADTITDAVVDVAPSQNAVYDALALKAPLASPVLTGVPEAPTATLGTATTQIATTAFVEANTNQIVSLTPSASQDDYSTGITLTSKASALIRIAPTNSIQITGISATGAVDGKTIVIRNNTTSSSSSARMIILARENTASSAANRFTYAAAAAPIILMPGDTATFRYDTSNSRWNYTASTRNGSPSAFFDVFNDAMIYNAFNTTSSGTGAGLAFGDTFVANSTQKAMGTILCGTGTTSTGSCYYGGGNESTMKGGSGAAIFLARVAAPSSLSDGTNTYTLNIGFNDIIGTGSVVDGVYWRYDQSVSTDWRTVTSNNSSQTINTVTGFTVSTTVMPYLGIFINGDWTNVEYFYSTDGVSWTFFSTQTTTNIPTATTRLFGLQSGITKSAGTSARYLDIDFIGMRYDAVRGN